MMKALAVVAHPDDIEFMLAGTLLRLKNAGCEIHMWNLADGCQGTEVYSKADIARIRLEEAREAATLAGAIFHEPLFEDLAIFYDALSLARVSAVIREIQPDIILTHGPSDYMEDHQNACRLAVSAAFARAMVNFETIPARSAYNKPVRIYHSLPHSLLDFRGREVAADLYVDIGPVVEQKRQMLECHRSQKDWLDASQGMGAYTTQMLEFAQTVGVMSGGFCYAEGLIRHNHIGFCSPDFDPVVQLLSPNLKLV